MRLTKYLLGILVLVGGAVWFSVFNFPDANFRLIACDVGQGDAILAVYKNIQILTDGGPDNKVLECLSRHIPFWDREIELVILTHPQLDHFGGLIEVFRRYKVNTFLTNKEESSSQSYELLKNAVGGNGTRVINPKGGITIRLDLIHLDILHPSGEDKFSNLNDYSIVTLLGFGEFEALLTGDIGPKGISEFLSKNTVGPVEYIKVPHHGSRNGLTQNLLGVVEPKVAVISVGKNTYGHPHDEIINMFLDNGVRVLRTDKMGDIEVISDGRGWKVTKN